MLGDLFSEFFIRKESHRKEGEDLVDYEPRFRQLIRRLEKAVKETSDEAKIPLELYGWFLLNVYMRLDASDTANVRGRAESYKLEDVFGALKKMWSGGGLCARDRGRKKGRDGQNFLAEDPDDVTAESSLGPDEPSFGTEEDGLSEVEEATAWFQDALEAVLEEPTDSSILANFKDARKALDQARTARGFYPVRHPGARDGKKSFPRTPGRGDGGSSSQSSQMTEIHCFRCGKKGHKARFCPQRPQGRSNGNAAEKVGYVGVVQCLDDSVNSVQPEDPMLTSVFGQIDGTLRGQAIIDSGASDNIVGVETLEALAEELEGLGFSVEQEVTIDHNQRKRFTFGNSACDAALGKAYVTTGIFGHEVEIEVHVVEGSAPFLLSAKFLSDMNTTIDFRSGIAVFRKLSEHHYR